MSAFWNYVFGYPWAMDTGTFRRMEQILIRHSIGERLSRDEIAATIGRAPETADPRNRKYEVSGTTAIIPVQGVLAKHADEVNGMSQPRGMSYEALQKQISIALADPSVNSILLHFESPGGSVNGLRETVESVRAARLKKPIAAHIEGMCASAAYWLAAATDHITASDSALIGSIGTIMVMEDWSKRYEMEGVKTIVARSHPDKALGQGGEEIPQREIDHANKIVGELGKVITDSVLELRGISDELHAQSNFGQVHLPTAAIAMKLIDRVSTFEEALAELGAHTTRSTLGAPKSATASAILTAAGIPPSAPPAGSAPVTHRRNDTMLKAAVLAALCAAHPASAGLIVTMNAAAGDGKDAKELEGEIKAAIHAAENKALTDKATALEAQIAASNTAHKAEIAGKDAQIAALTKKVNDLSALGDKAPDTVGGDHTASAIKGLNGEELWKAEFERSAELQDNYGGDVKAYIANKRAEAKNKTGKGK